MIEMLKAAKAAKSEVCALTTVQKNTALEAMADALLTHMDSIMEANQKDIDRASATIAPVMLDRLRLTPDRIKAMASGIREVAALPDPVGRVLSEHTRTDALCHTNSRY